MPEITIHSTNRLWPFSHELHGGLALMPQLWASADSMFVALFSWGLKFSLHSTISLLNLISHSCATTPLPSLVICSTSSCSLCSGVHALMDCWCGCWGMGTGGLAGC
ncbi:hypothetical protein I7I48_03060 [Histoplasma ohiense]|nr:hypothetical protein I7I48_03060 [Histoplasma ohiense (nom. inval.)]